MAHSYRHDLKDQLLAEANGPATVPKESGSGDQSVTGNLTVAGNATVSAALTVTGISTLSGAVTVTNVFTGSGGIKFPTADPSIVGAWWDNAGTLTRSNG